MVSKKVTVRNKSGLHMRPATDLSKLCAKLESSITIVFGGKKINPKSVLMLLSGGIKCGSTVEVVCEGDNENSDLAQIVEAINGGFGEEMVN